MINRIEQENILEVQDVVKEIKLGLFDLLNLSKQLLIFLMHSSRDVLYNFSEYSYDNIKKQGLKQILYRRALRFFKLDNNSEPKETNPQKKVKKKTFISIGRTVFKFILTPIYFLLIFIMWIKNKKYEKKQKNFYST